ncbi:MAG: response regulator [Fimbriimonadales bacterium]|nr:response regulator [Fimbriimonadales bacterium]
MRILVVDDEPMVQLLLRQALADEGHEVEIAPNGVAALELLTQRNYDLLFTDIHMPRKSGIDLVRALRQQGERIPIVVMDSYPDLFAESEVGAEAFALLAKPFDLCEVRRVLREIEFALTPDASPAPQERGAAAPLSHAISEGAGR